MQSSRGIYHDSDGVGMTQDFPESYSASICAHSRYARLLSNNPEPFLIKSDSNAKASCLCLSIASESVGYLGYMPRVSRDLAIGFPIIKNFFQCR